MAYRFQPGEAVVEVPLKSSGCVVLEMGPKNNDGKAGFTEEFPKDLREALMNTPEWYTFIQGANDMVYETYEKSKWNCWNFRMALVALPCIVFGALALTAFIYLMVAIGGVNEFWAGVFVATGIASILVMAILLGGIFKAMTEELLVKLQSHCASTNEATLPKGLTWKVRYTETFWRGYEIWLEGNICSWASQASWQQPPLTTKFGKVGSPV
mmetsp:Transcript_40431/g.114502  ORF Transcript_40431/g.114502 Transcript_40431/m.114502 type:complete len:212 (+) Transcript_40431:451-1086(+)|eukprot:CAMPEP_0117680652 /NCGR_PEP_ID=MMETSP0804-20121206/18485_1 /TAXON_ID=1074897 /ORGANISM="Tetraselmis astigmatica, Strain CCMP880" /LENGTH=211 /DNA_ID=CAMNT_0005490201 /DNA_START=412 /DNA_END=1047 /DNA_ORIENTATION=-